MFLELTWWTCLLIHWEMNQALLLIQVVSCNNVETIFLMIHIVKGCKEFHFSREYEKILWCSINDLIIWNQGDSLKFKVTSKWKKRLSQKDIFHLKTNLGRRQNMERLKGTCAFNVIYLIFIYGIPNNMEEGKSRDLDLGLYITHITL